MTTEKIKTLLFYFIFLLMIAGGVYLVNSFQDMPSTYIETTYGSEFLNK